MQRTASAMKPQTLLAVFGAVVGCADHPYEPDAPAFDRNAPRVHIVSPARGTIAGDVTHVLVTGTASDDLGIKSVSVNGAQTAVADDGTVSGVAIENPNVMRETRPNLMLNLRRSG